MSTNTNFTIKHYNGTDYDRMNPATIVEQVDGDWDLTKVKNVLSASFGGTGVSSIDDLKSLLNLEKYPMFTSGFYIGTGTYGASNQNTLTFDFYPRMMIVTDSTLLDDQYSIVWFKTMTTPTSAIGVPTFTTSGKTISWYSTNNNYGVYYQNNVSGKTYYYFVLGSPTEYNISELWTTPGTYSYTVPQTGNYYLELHAAGGNPASTWSYNGNYGRYEIATGGGSGSVYNIRLTKGQVISISIPDKGSSANAVFGSYSVTKGGDASGTTGGTASGNVANGGSNIQIQDTEVNTLLYGITFGGGVYGKSYGFGGGAHWNGTVASTLTSVTSSGCVYLKYIEN